MKNLRVMAMFYLYFIIVMLNVVYSINFLNNFKIGLLIALEMIFVLETAGYNHLFYAYPLMVSFLPIVFEVDLLKYAIFVLVTLIFNVCFVAVKIIADKNFFKVSR